MTDEQTIAEALNAFLEPLRPMFELSGQLDKLGDAETEIANAERRIGELRSTETAVKDRITAIKAEIETAQHEAATILANCRSEAMRTHEDAQAKADGIVAEAKSKAESIVNAAKARAAEIEQALAGAQSRLAAVRR